MSFTPSLIYIDPKAALVWLEKAFGFETTLLIEDSDGNVVKADMAFLGSTVDIRGRSLEWRKSPLELGGANTQSIEVRLASGIDAHCERARAAGARIIFEPEDHFYGERQYSAVDLEGHVWSFSQRIRDVSNQELASAGGLTVKTSL